MKFRKKPVVIEAVQWTGENYDEIYKWRDQFPGVDKPAAWKGNMGDLLVPTLEDHNAEYHCASPGDWIIRGVNGEFYPCKPDIFEKTYEKVI